MRRRVWMAAGFLGVATWLVTPAAFAASSNEHADMAGSEEVPGPGAAGAKGTADIVLDDAAGTLCYTLAYEGIGAPTAAHVHTGAQGVAGPVAVDLQIAKNGPKGCVPVDSTMLASIRDDPGGHYVNVHTADYPKGALRGQLVKK